ncbi:hypothetical protein CCH79_00004377 [Gambusia affinis]|uniref:Uncharacterized protein n=1 Tax=Gambusia affinis TaxID=33528 RepID=A0A315V047_GAMAF|nr:hypothetical protein CCH79_00004377 [Gambusia affinis]
MFEHSRVLPSGLNVHSLPVLIPFSSPINLNSQSYFREQTVKRRDLTVRRTVNERTHFFRADVFH